MYLLLDKTDGHCCLTQEVCNFRYSNTAGGYYTFISGQGDTHAAAAADAIAQLKSKVQNAGHGDFKNQYDGSQVFFFWFKKPRDYKGNFADQWEYEELRQELLKQDNVTELGEFLNSNSDNKLLGYMWTLDLENNRDDDEDYDEY